MERWPVQQFVSTKSIVAVQREFRRIFGDNQRGVAPSRKIISVWVRQWRETGSVQNKARVRQKTARTPDNVERVRTALQRSPYRSVRRHSRIMNLSVRSMRRFYTMICTSIHINSRSHKN